MPASALRLDIQLFNKESAEFVVSRNDPLLSWIDKSILIFLLLLIPLRVRRLWLALIFFVGLTCVVGLRIHPP